MEEKSLTKFLSIWVDKNDPSLAPEDLWTPENCPFYLFRRARTNCIISVTL